MPNHVTNELIFRGLTSEKRAEILANVVNAEGRVDFEILVPLPLNIWWGDVAKKHEEAFRKTALDWCRENWGTKWNAYDCEAVIETEDGMVIVFNTAWLPPYPWLAAVFNRFRVAFDHNWMSEGDNIARHGVFSPRFDRNWGHEEWREDIADDELQRRIHVLKWGCERFEDDNDTVIDPA